MRVLGLPALVTLLLCSASLRVRGQSTAAPSLASVASHSEPVTTGVVVYTYCFLSLRDPHITYLSDVFQIHKQDRNTLYATYPPRFAQFVADKYHVGTVGPGHVGSFGCEDGFDTELKASTRRAADLTRYQNNHQMDGAVEVPWNGVFVRQDHKVSESPAQTFSSDTALPSASSSLGTTQQTTQQQPVQQVPQKRASLNQAETKMLAKCVGLNGVLSKSEDIENWKLVYAELQRRANRGNDYEALYSMGKEAEHPSIKGVEPDYKSAVSWYRAGAVRHDMRASYHLGDLSVRGLGTPRNSMGESWMQHAVIHGYLPDKDRMETDVEHDAEVSGTLGGILAWMSAAGRGQSGSNQAPKGACYVKEQVWVPIAGSKNGEGNWETRSKLAEPWNCK